jgi:hypothetical protein
MRLPLLILAIAICQALAMEPARRAIDHSVFVGPRALRRARALGNVRRQDVTLSGAASQTETTTTPTTTTPGAPLICGDPDLG